MKKTFTKFINVLLVVIVFIAFFVLTAEYPDATFFQDTIIRVTCLATMYACALIGKKTAPDMFTEDEEI